MGERMLFQRSEIFISKIRHRKMVKKLEKRTFFPKKIKKIFFYIF